MRPLLHATPKLDPADVRIAIGDISGPFSFKLSNAERMTYWPNCEMVTSATLR